MQGHTETLQLLLNKGAAIDRRKADGWTALFLAAVGSHTPTVRALLVAGASPLLRDHQGCPPLLVAAHAGAAEAVAELLAAPGVEVNATSNRGLTAL